MNQLDALAIGSAALAGVDRQRAIEVVHDQQQLLEDVDDRLIGLLAPLALDALAVVVELRALAEPAILVVVALPLQIGDLGAFGFGDGGVGSVVQRFISHKTRSSGSQHFGPQPGSGSELTGEALERD